MSLDFMDISKKVWWRVNLKMSVIAKLKYYSILKTIPSQSMKKSFKIQVFPRENS